MAAKDQGDRWYMYFAKERHNNSKYNEDALLDLQGFLGKVEKKETVHFRLFLGLQIEFWQN